MLHRIDADITVVEVLADVEQFDVLFVVQRNAVRRAGNGVVLGFAFLIAGSGCRFAIASPAAAAAATAAATRLFPVVSLDVCVARDLAGRFHVTITVHIVDLVGENFPGRFVHLHKIVVGEIGVVGECGARFCSHPFAGVFHLAATSSAAPTSSRFFPRRFRLTVATAELGFVSGRRRSVDGRRPGRLRVSGSFGAIRPLRRSRLRAFFIAAAFAVASILVAPRFPATRVLTRRFGAFPARPAFSTSSMASARITRRSVVTTRRKRRLASFERRRRDGRFRRRRGGRPDCRDRCDGPLHGFGLQHGLRFGLWFRLRFRLWFRLKRRFLCRALNRVGGSAVVHGGVVATRSHARGWLTDSRRLRARRGWLRACSRYRACPPPSARSSPRSSSPPPAAPPPSTPS